MTGLSTHLRRFPWSALALWITTSVVLADAAPALPTAQPQPALSREVRDLQYGEVLYNFFQQRYFTAAVHLQVGKARGQLPGNADDAELLLGGLYLSYGIHDEAEAIFNRLLDAADTPQVRNRAWYFLARIRYQKGLIDEAERVLGRVDGSIGDDLADELLNLRANLLIARQRHAEAAELLKQSGSQRKLAVFARYNLAVSLITAGQSAEGVPMLQAIARGQYDEPELRALSDKAWLALGFAHLRDDPATAQIYFSQVRVDGPFSAKALLGAGWADYLREDYRAALVTWTELRKRDARDPAHYESWLATANALEKLQANSQAAEAFEAAIAFYREELERVAQARQSMSGGAVWDGLLEQVARDELGWFWEAELTPAQRESHFISELIATNAFHEQIKNLRDLRFLITLLDRWQLEVPAYRYMVELRRIAYQEGVPRLSAERVTARVGELQDQRDQYAAQLALLEREDRYATQFRNIDRQSLRILMSEDELPLQSRLDSVKERLDTLGQHPDAGRIRERYRLLSGALQWRVLSEYRERWWAIKKQLNETDRLLTETLERQLDLERAAVLAPRGFDGYDERLDALQLRMDALRSRIDQVHGLQQRHMATLAEATLSRLQQQLVDYFDQARFALARLQDRSTAEPRESSP